ncbi:hypothetical protein AKJ16_DCAP07816, partial [Drosera capensis]
MTVEAALIPIHQTQHVLRPPGFEPLSSFILGDSCAPKPVTQAKLLALLDANNEHVSAPLHWSVSVDPQDDSGSISTSLSNLHLLKDSSLDSSIKEKSRKKPTKKKNGKQNRETKKAIQGLLAESGQIRNCEDDKVSGSSQQSAKDDTTVVRNHEHDAEMRGEDVKMCVVDAVKGSCCHSNEENKRSRWNKSLRDKKHAQINSQKMPVLDYLNIDVSMLEKVSSPRIESHIVDESSSVSSVSSWAQKSSTVESSVTYPHEKVHPVTDECFLQPEANFSSSFDYRRNKGSSRNSEKQSQGGSFYEGQHLPRFGKDVTHVKILRRWVPICKNNVKNSKTAASVKNIISCSDKSQLPSEKNDNCIVLGGNTEMLGPTVSSRGSVSVSSVPIHRSASQAQEEPEVHRMESEIQIPMAQPICNGTSSSVLSDGSSDCINCVTVEHALEASYRLQLACENAERAIGHPLVEFERLLQCVTPVIVSPSSSKACETCSCNQRHSPSVCGHPIPSTSLKTVWNWYEEPGNYGMKVGVQGSRYQEASRADHVSFDAHFVPLLSAVQLFGHEKLSPCCSESEENAVERVQENKDAALQSSSSKPSSISSSLTDVNSDAAFNSFKQTVGPSKAPHIHRCDVIDRSFPPTSDDMELMFEFFESEQPHQRMPLYDKVLELASAGILGNHGFGDASKLQCANLCELHPASWFSVAWYPIYRIPEGKLRAAFLTYHSLGHSVHRCVATDTDDKNALCIILFPVVGLQSYRAQDGLWFHPKLKIGERLAFKALASQLVEDRTRTLEENALFFARGLVDKDHGRVANRQPDFEFFKSRKVINTLSFMIPSCGSEPRNPRRRVPGSQKMQQHTAVLNVNINTVSL